RNAEIHCAARDSREYRIVRASSLIYAIDFPVLFLGVYQYLPLQKIKMAVSICKKKSKLQN
ncbi:MAG: hypothetical protein KBD99_04525, partial [Enterococcus sp.]|nr:hypothetical protein [Enterococcus sp.]MDD2466220.1 hypothetical protein [Desulfobulbus sp.]